MEHNGKISPGRIGFDIDGVVADTAEAFIRLARQDHGINTISAEDITEFEVEECLDIPPVIIETVFARILNDPLAVGLKPMKNAVRVLKELAGQAPLTFVTARPDGRPIADWLAHVLGDVFAEARLIAMGEHDNKAGYIKDLGLDFFVDDRAQTCLMLQEAGITPLVYDQPWNRGQHQFQTVGNWLDIRALCF